jgi:hypothetical protein
MTVADVSARDQHAIRAVEKALEDEVRINPPGTHHPDYPEVGRILESADPSQVRCRVRTPVAGKGDYFWFEFPGHFFQSLQKDYSSKAVSTIASTSLSPK